MGLSRAGKACAYVIVSAREAAFIDCGTGNSVDALIAAVDAVGLSADDVRYVIPTHVHLDHAGGAGALLARCVNAELVVHPRGARHLIDPTRLVAAASEVYGAAQLKRIFGEVMPCLENRVIESQDGDILALGARDLQLLHTPGHAKHHHCVLDMATVGVFSGDILGVSYREFDTPSGDRFAMPVTSPSQFDEVEMRQSLDRIAALSLTAAYLTHFGRVDRVAALVSGLHDDLDFFLAAALDVWSSVAEQNRQEALCARLEGHLLERALHQLLSNKLSKEAARRVLRNDIELSAQGLLFALKRAEKSLRQMSIDR